MATPFETKRLRSGDGTELRVYAAGDPEAPPMLLCGGLGGGFDIWRPFLARFADRYRLLSWDYRGLYGSGRAVDGSGYGMECHVADLLHVAESEGAEAPVLVGWSMGAQLGLELHRARPDLLRAFVALHGTPGRPLATAFDSPRSAQVAPLVLGLLRLVGPRFGAVGPRLTRSPTVVRSFVWANQRLGFMAPTLDVAAFRDIGEEWTKLDLGVYAEIFEALGAHDASDLLPAIRTPTLLIAGGRDRFTPCHLAERMAAAMPNAVLEVLPDATHFSLLEFPERVCDRVERFLDESGASSRPGPR